MNSTAYTATLLDQHRAAELDRSNALRRRHAEQLGVADAPARIGFAASMRRRIRGREAARQAARSHRVAHVR
ncbi:hypothetical protein LK09_08530 [Microbacterium mangrovi]|uniref:Uncharacterized protein n=1 Tax=Microbacterium mangrovi TaxID=1348253 RepID=A0A0B2ABC8_9MICO|nr:hypothetical protein [Microbacterium mangrovi]KHK98892.1 hypothetical protein LK09_08530 [Microbacterium mangrovi]